MNIFAWNQIGEDTYQLYFYNRVSMFCFPDSYSDEGQPLSWGVDRGILQDRVKVQWQPSASFMGFGTLEEAQHAAQREAIMYLKSLSKHLDKAIKELSLMGLTRDLQLTE